MKASDAVEQIDEIIGSLEAAKTTLESHDTYDFDISRKLQLMSEVSEEVSDYVSDIAE